MNDLAGLSAVVTGGLTGQGLAIAQELAGLGAHVAVGSFVREAAGRSGDAAAYPDPEEIATVRGALQAHGGKVFAGHLDVRDAGAVKAFLADAHAACGRPDILVNAAGTTAEQPVSGHSDELWLKIIDTNLNGAFRMIREVLPGMMERGFGRIVNIGSTAAEVGWKDNPAYCASKSGLLGLDALRGAGGRGAWRDLRDGQPDMGGDRTDAAQCRAVAAREGKGRKAADLMAEIAAQNPQQRIIQPDEIAALVAFLCGKRARGITMENIKVTGGAHW